MTTDQQAKLHSAIEDGDLETLKALLEQSPRSPDLLNSSDNQGWTPLMKAVAAIDRKLEVTELLIARGARADRACADGREALHLLPQGTGEQTQGKWPGLFVRCLLEAGADLEAVTSWGWTPLVSAVVEGDEEHLRAFLAAGANPNVRISPRAFPVFTRGWTLAHFCTAQAEGARFLNLLIDAKLDLTWRNDQGDTVLELCERTLRDPEGDMDQDYLENVKACERLLRDR